MSVDSSIIRFGRENGPNNSTTYDPNFHTIISHVCQFFMQETIEAQNMLPLDNNNDNFCLAGVVGHSSRNIHAIIILIFIYYQQRFHGRTNNKYHLFVFIIVCSIIFFQSNGDILSII